MANQQRGVEKSAPCFESGCINIKFRINNIEWQIVFVNPFSDDLRRSDRTLTLGVTDMPKRSVFLSNALTGALLRKVLAHELCHTLCFSYNIHIPIEQEEFLADWVATYGTEVIYLLDELMQTMKKAYIA